MVDSVQPFNVSQYMQDQQVRSLQLQQMRAQTKDILETAAENSGFRNDVKSMDRTQPIMEQLAKIQQAALSHGKLDTATQVSTTMANIAYKQSAEDTKTAQAEKFRTEAQTKLRQNLTAGLAAANNQQEWDMARTLLTASTPKELMSDDMKQLLQMPYTPDAVKYLRQLQVDPEQQRKRDKDAADADLKEKDQKRKQAETDARIALDRARARAEAALEKQRLEKVDKEAKNGGPGAKISAAERLNADQMIRAGNELFTGFDEILKLGPTSLGPFSDIAYHNDPTYLGSAKKWMANKMTEDEQHAYATRLAGVNVAAAILASGGRAPRVSQMEAEKQALAELAGQSHETFFDKIHQATLKAIRGIEISRTDDPQQLNNLKMVQSRLEAVEKETRDSLEKLRGAKATTGPKDGDTRTSKSGKPIVFRNGQWEYK